MDYSNEAGVCFRDPVVHSLTADKFGVTDGGKDAMTSFFSRHKCNRFCQSGSACNIAAWRPGGLAARQPPMWFHCSRVQAALGLSNKAERAVQLALVLRIHQSSMHS